MTHPPTRADQVRMMSSGGSRKVPPRQAQMTALDMEDDRVRPDAWFVYVMPIQSGVEMMGAGRYGYWDSQPSVKLEEDWVVVSGKDDEPIFVAPRTSVVSVHAAQARHIEATPFPILEPTTPDTAA